VPVEAWIEGDDGEMTLAALDSLLAGQGGGSSLTVRLEGIGDGLGSVIAWELEVEIDE
jgi:hypothetical protein